MSTHPKSGSDVSFLPQQSGAQRLVRGIYEINDLSTLDELSAALQAFPTTVANDSEPHVRLIATTNPRGGLAAAPSGGDGRVFAHAPASLSIPAR